MQSHCLRARSLSIPALFVAWLGLAATPARAQRPVPVPQPMPPFQFRVNATHSSAWSAGLDMASVAVKPTGSLSFAWVALASEQDAPNCPNLLLDCDGFEIAPDSGESQTDPDAVVFARDFDRFGRALEPADTGIDPVLACISNRRFPSIAARKTHHALRGVVSAWDFSWNPILSPCNTFCGPFCFMHIVGHNATAWPSDGPPLPAGPHPGLCNTGTPSVAFSDVHSLDAWIDVSTLCSEVWGRLDDLGAFEIRGHDFGNEVWATCAGAGRLERFVVLWNEFEDATNLTTVRLRRVDDGVLGDIVDVAPTDRPAAMSVFDDGSFAVFWWDTTDVLDPRGRLALYDAAEPPALVAPFIDITTFVPFPPMGPTPSSAKLTVTVLGSEVLDEDALALCVWEGHSDDDDPPGIISVRYRLVDPLTRQVGRERPFALDSGQPKVLGESWQHTVVFRRDGMAAGVWTGHEHGQPLPERNVYCTVRRPQF